MGILVRRIISKQLIIDYKMLKSQYDGYDITYDATYFDQNE